MAVIRAMEMVRARNGSPTARLKLVDGTSYYLHSTYSPEREAGDWLKGYQLTDDTMYVVLGFGLGYHVEALYRRLPRNSRIVIIEPREERSLYAGALLTKRFGWWNDKKITVIMSDKIREIASTVSSIMRGGIMNGFTIMRHYPSTMIDEEFYDEVLETLTRRTRELFKINNDFYLSAGAVIFENSWQNLPDILQTPSLEGLRGAFSGRPALMVAAGPSLNQALPFIEQHRHRFVIICAGSAVAALAARGIVPHFVVVVDPFPVNDADLVDFLDRRSYLVCPHYASHELVKNSPSSVLFYNLQMTNPVYHSFGDKLRELFPPTVLLPGNISVASSALALAVFLDCSPIVLAGLNLAFSREYTDTYLESNRRWAERAAELQSQGKKMDKAEHDELLQSEYQHARGVKAGAYVLNQSNTAWAEGWTGERLVTTVGFRDVIDFFGEYCRLLGNQRFVNISVGGARIGEILHQSPADYFAGLGSEEGQHLYGHGFDLIAERLRGFRPTERKTVTKALRRLLSAAGREERRWQNFWQFSKNLIADDNPPEPAINEYLTVFNLTLRRTRRSVAFDLISNHLKVISNLTAFAQMGKTDGMTKLRLHIIKTNEIIRMLTVARTGLAAALAEMAKGE
ncbi:MAG: DUF115 domain-containing protein [Negativicutes bacterium]|nr:DUF115 domain-containing protein [Negativicutes bacterium]